MKQSLTLKSKANKYYPHKANRSFWRIVFIVIIGMIFYFHSVAQTKDSLIADETYIRECPVLVKITTSNETIHNMLITKFKPARKMEKSGVHWVYYKKEDVPAIKEWLVLINRKIVKK